MYRRLLDIVFASERRSIFLFGPRAVGKSTLLRTSLPDVPYYDLLDSSTLARLVRRPSLLEEETNPAELVIIDEIQKLPSLLDEVHRLIANRNQRFILTGSSARKLKRGAANLLAGRARWLHMHPLVSREIPGFELATYLETGGLPQLYGEPQARLDLRSYVDLYLREEVIAEALTRNAGGFTRLLDALALCNGEKLNLASLSSDTGVQARTVANYIEILEDTLLAFRLPVYRKTRSRKTTARSKLYFFDIGVVNTLCGRTSVASSPELFGKAFEHFIVLEVHAWLDYAQSDAEMSFWRTQSGFEVDFLIGDAVAVEVKSSDMVSDKHLKGLRALREELSRVRAIVVSRDPSPRRTADGIEIVPWRVFLEELWEGRIVATTAR